MILLPSCSCGFTDFRDQVSVFIILALLSTVILYSQPVVTRMVKDMSNQVMSRSPL